MVFGHGSPSCPLWLSSWFCQAEGRKIDSTPPGGRRFIANKGQTVIQQPYDSLVEAIFLSTFGSVLADC
jgi:hypothetical protein